MVPFTVQILNALFHDLYRRHDHPRHGPVHPVQLAHHRLRGHLAHGDCCSFAFVAPDCPEPRVDDIFVVNTAARWIYRVWTLPIFHLHSVALTYFA